MNAKISSLVVNMWGFNTGFNDEVWLIQI
jgi:hypothetical protein